MGVLAQENDRVAAVKLGLLHQLMLRVHVGKGGEDARVLVVGLVDDPEDLVRAGGCPHLPDVDAFDRLLGPAGPGADGRATPLGIGGVGVDRTADRENGQDADKTEEVQSFHAPWD